MRPPSERARHNLDLFLEIPDCLFQVVNHSEMPAEQESMMGRDLALQRHRQGFARRGQPTVAQGRQLLGVGLAGAERFEHSSPALTKHVRHH